MERRSRNHIIIGALDTPESQQTAKYAGNLIRSERENADVEIVDLGEDADLDTLAEALLAERIDLFAMPAPELPVPLPDGIAIAGAPVRADVRSALLSRAGEDLRSLPAGTKIGVCAASDAAQIGANYPDLELVQCAGGLEDRLETYLSGEVDALVVAISDLADAGKKDLATSYLLINDIIPPAGQGILAFVARQDDAFTKEILERMGNKNALQAVLAERMVVQGVLDDAGDDAVATAFARSVPDGSFRVDAYTATRSGGDAQKTVDAGLGPAWDLVAQRIVHNLRGE